MASDNGRVGAEAVREPSQLDEMASSFEHLLERIQLAISRTSKSADALFGGQETATSSGPSHGGGDKQPTRSGAIGRIHDSLDRGHNYVTTLENELNRFHQYQR